MEGLMEHDPDGLTQQVAVIMTGQIYRDAGLKHSKHPRVEGLLYDKLCQINKHKLRDDVRKMAIHIAMGVNDKEFKPTVDWLDSFMRRFCLSRKKMGFHSTAMLKRKGQAQNSNSAEASPAIAESGTSGGLTQEDVMSVLGINVEAGNGTKDAATDPAKDQDAQNATPPGNNSQTAAANNVASAAADGDTAAPNQEFENTSIQVSNKILEEVIAETEKTANEQNGDAVSLDGLDFIEKIGNNDGKDSDQDIFLSDNDEKPATSNGTKENNDKNEKVCEEVKELQDLEKLTKEIIQSSEEVEEVDISQEVEEKEQDSSNDSQEENEESSKNNSDNDSDNNDTPAENTADAPKVSRQEADENSIIYCKEEEQYWKKNFKDLKKKLSDSVMRCSSCNEQINHKMRSLVHTHPVLGILMCKRCRKYYGKGKFCKDDEGYDEYCRICAEGGDLLCCEQKDCFNGFCKRCIKRTMGRSELKNAETKSNWACYICDCLPMMELRALHRMIISNLTESQQEDDQLNRKDLQKKALLSKFDSLKRSRKEKQMASPVKSTKKNEAKSNSKSDKANPASTNQKWMKEHIDHMTELMTICLKNVEKIDKGLKKGNYSEESSAKAGNRLLKQIEGMKNICSEVESFMLNDAKLNGVELTTINSTTEKSDETEIDDKKQTKGKQSSKKKIENDSVKAVVDPDKNEASKKNSKGKEKDKSKNKLESDSEKASGEQSDDSSKAPHGMDDDNSAMEDDPPLANASDDDDGDAEMADPLDAGDDEAQANGEVDDNTANEGGDKEKDTVIKTGGLKIRKPEELLSQSALDDIAEDKDDDDDKEKKRSGKSRKTSKESEPASRRSSRLSSAHDDNKDGKDETRKGRTTRNRVAEDSENNEDEEPKKSSTEKRGEKSKQAKSKLESEDESDTDKASRRRVSSRKKNECQKENGKLSGDEESDEKEKKTRGKKKDSGTEKDEKKRTRSNKDSEEESPTKKPKKKKKKDEEEDDLLGIDSTSSNKSSSEEEDTDTEIRRRRAEYEDHSEKKKQKRKLKVKKEAEDDSEKEVKKDDSTDQEKENKSKVKSSSKVRKEKKSDAEANGSDKEAVEDKENAKKSSSKKSPKKKLSAEEKENKEALNDLLASDSDENAANGSEQNNDNDGEGKDKKSKSRKEKQEKKSKKENSDKESSDDEGKDNKDKERNEKQGKKSKKEKSENESSENEGDDKKNKGKKNQGKKSKKEKSENESDDKDDDEDEKDKKTSKKNSKKDKKSSKSPVKTDNQKAMASILEDSDSEGNLEDKPKPKCKKKSFLKKRAKQMERLKCLTEEELEQLKEQQLDGRAQVVVKRLQAEVMEQLKEEEVVNLSDYPELTARRREGTDKYYGDADEEDSEEEFEKLMKFKMKPGPKSKKMKGKKAKEEEEEKDEAEDEDEADDNKEGEDKKEKGKKGGKGGNRKKKEGLLDISIEKEDEEEEDDDDDDEDKKKKKRVGGGISLNEKMKKQILMSSDEGNTDDSEEEFKESPEQEDKRRSKYEEKKKKKKEEDEKEREAEGLNKDDDDDDEDFEAPKVHKKGWMNLNISSDDGEVGEKDEDHVVNSDDDEEEEEEEEDDEGEDEDDDDSDFEESPRKRRAFQISSSDSEDDKKKKKNKSKKASESEAESEELDETPKSKRKRIRKLASSSDEGGEGEESPSKRKIRRVMRDEDLTQSTKDATQEEQERRKRIAERQKKYNQMFEVDVETDQKDLGKLVLDFDPESQEELVSVHERLAKQLKPHQFKGIKFMWDATCESVEMVRSKPGGGCVLAHCMGLGKTLQVITFTHTLLTNKKVNKSIQRIMVCCPVNTVYNWVSEYNNWLKGKLLSFDVTELASAKDLWSRAYRLDDWWKEGGICIMGYDMFRNLSNPKSKRYKGKMKEIFYKTLIDPGPDLIVCDEGHILKNEKTGMSIAINKVKTLRRVILTGTPLQNNLKEYHCMIQFVKPNLLGTKKEFLNRFANPIEQGQCVDAMPRDVRRMKRRAHILHNLLEGCVQRMDYTVLKPFLPPKLEYVISVQMSDVQIKLYQYYLDNLAQGGPKRQGSGLFVDFGALSRVWTHPKVLDLAVRKALFEDDEEGDEMADFICDDTTEEESSEEERKKSKKKKQTKKKGSDDEEDIVEELDVQKDETEAPGAIPGLTESGKVRVDWWKRVVEEVAGEDFEEEGYLEQFEHGGKIILLFDILRECCSIGDKVLVFSQSLLALDMIEDFLELVDRGELDLPAPEDPLPLPYKHWKKDRDYLRLDGSTNAESRKSLCKTFNSPQNERCRLFLISTRAGGLGINLVAANRVVIFDSSWNPSHDTQSIFRVYRFGQKKPSYVYRFVAQGTMEEKIYSRQVAKMSTALRVVDEHQIKRYFKMDELAQLYEFNPSEKDTRETPIVPNDPLLAELLKRHKQWIVNYHEHDSLLENQTGEELSEEERKAAWEDYENEKKGLLQTQNYQRVMPVVGTSNVGYGGMGNMGVSTFSFENVVSTIKMQNPNLSQAEMCESVLLATKQIQKIHLNQYQKIQGMLYNLKNPMIAPEQRKLLPFGSHPEMLPMLEQQLHGLQQSINQENQVIQHMSSLSSRNTANNMANLISAGLVRGQPTSSGMNAATASYVSRGKVTTQAAQQQQQQQQQQQNSTGQKTTTNDVILLD